MADPWMFERGSRVEAELGVQRQRAVVISGLRQPNSRDISLTRPPQHVLHQPSSDGDILRGRGDGDGADASDGPALPQEVAAEHPPVGHGEVALVETALDHTPEDFDVFGHGHRSFP